MSWLDRTNTDFIITCGNGRQFKPLYLNTQKTVEYNTSEFEFPELAGTLVKRGKPKGRRYNLEIYFQGEDNIDEAESFETASNDSRPWVISHPYYGEITVQPLSLLFDNSSYNVTKITGVVVETITEDAPKGGVDPVDKIAQDNENVGETLSQSMANDVVLTQSDLLTLENNTYKMYTQATDTVKTSEQAEEYTNLFNTANAAIIDATSEPLAAARAVQAVINAPALFETSVLNRLNLFKRQFDTLRDTLEVATDKVKKKLFENNGGSIINGMLLAASTPISTDYVVGTEILATIDTIFEYYETYLDDIDSLQSENGGSEDSYVPDFESQSNLSALVNFTLSNLFTLVYGSKQERKIYLESDSNVIILAHRFYGLEVDDSTIYTFLNVNQIGLNEMLQIRKGREITYYV